MPKPRIVIRQLEKGFHRFELISPTDQIVFRGVNRIAVEEVKADIDRLTEELKSGKAIKSRLLAGKTFLAVATAGNNVLGYSKYLTSPSLQDETKQQLPQWVLDAVIDNSEDSSGADDYPDIDWSLKTIFRTRTDMSATQQLSALTSAFGPTPVQNRLLFLISTNDQYANAAAGALAHTLPPRISIATQAVDMGSTSVKVVVAHTLPEYTASDERDALLLRLLTDPHPLVAHRAVITAKHIGTPEMRSIIVDMSSSHADPFVRQVALTI